MDNLIRLREWSGNLNDLAVTNELVMLISYYRNIEARPFSAAAFREGESVVVMDAFEKGFKIVDEKGKSRFRKVKDLDWTSEYSVVSDALTGKNYLIDDKDHIYLFATLGKKCTLDLVGRLPDDGTFNRVAKAEEGIFYYVTQPSGTSAVSVLRKFKLEAR